MISGMMNIWFTRILLLILFIEWYASFLFRLNHSCPVMYRCSETGYIRGYWISCEIYRSLKADFQTRQLLNICWTSSNNCHSIAISYLLHVMFVYSKIYSYNTNFNPRLRWNGLQCNSTLIPKKYRSCAPPPP